MNAIYQDESSNYTSQPIMIQISHSPASQFICLRNVRVNQHCAAVECGKRASSKIRESGTLYCQNRLPGAIKCLCLKGGMAEREISISIDSILMSFTEQQFTNYFYIGYLVILSANCNLKKLFIARI